MYLHHTFVCRGGYTANRYTEILKRGRSISVCLGSDPMLSIKASTNSPLLPSFLPLIMSTSSFKPIPAEPVSEKDGLIHGVSAAELQDIGQKCLDARATAYCKLLHLRS
jgi:hypothetical protein